MRRKTRAAAGNLAALKGENALRFAPDARRRRRGQSGRWSPSRRWREGDRVLVRAGERVPADGCIEQGASAVDESAITGETLGKPVDDRRQ